MKISSILLIFWMFLGLGLLVIDLYFGIVWIVSGYLVREVEQGNIKEKIRNSKLKRKGGKK